MKMLKQSVLVTTITLLLAACGGGGGGSSSSTPTPANTVLPLNIHVSSTYSAGSTTVGDIIDARPFATTTKFIVTFTNPYSSVNITQINLGTGAGNISSDFSKTLGVGESGMKGYQISAYLSSNTCTSISASTPLTPGQSCTADYYTGDMFNFSNSESLSLKLGYEYTDTTHGKVTKFGRLTGNEALLPIVTGIIYTNGQGYDFNNNQVSTLLMTTESGQDYMYLNSGQKLKMAYDSNGKVILDFANNVVPCTNVGCSNGVVPSPLYSINPYTLQVHSGINANGVNGVIYGGGGDYSKIGGYSPTGDKIPNVNYIYAVQPDGTIFGQNSNAPYQWGCFNNDGSNFRSVTVNAGYQLSESQLFNYATTTLSYSYYGNTNWVMVNAAINSSGGSFFGRLIASTTGDCTISQDGSLASTEINWFQQQSSSTGMANYGSYITQQPLQITSHGVFGYYIYQYENPYPNNTPHFMFYKYPPRES